MKLIPLIQSAIRGAWRRRILMMMPLLIIIPLSGMVALLWPTKYETNALVLLQEYNGLSSDVPAYVRAQDTRDKVKSLEALTTSEFILRRIAKKYQKDPDAEPTEADLEEYRKRLSVNLVGTQFVQLTLTGGKREGLGNELSAILAALFESLLSSNQTSLNAPQFVVRTRRQELAELNARLRELEATGASLPEHLLKAKRTALAEVDQRIAALTPVFEREQRVLNEALGVAAPDLDLTGKPVSEIMTGLKRELTRLETDPNSKPFNEKERDTRISDLKQLLGGAENLQTTSKQLTTARTEQQAIRSDLTKAGSTVGEREKWQREANEIRARYGKIETRLQTSSAGADIQLLRAPAQIQVIDTPKDPKRPRNSRLLILIGGVMAAFAMSGGFAFLAEQLDGSLRGADMLRDATKLPVIADFALLGAEQQAQGRSLNGLAQLYPASTPLKDI